MESTPPFTADQRALVIKHHFLGHSVEQIAQYLNLDAATVVAVIDQVAESLEETALAFRQRKLDAGPSQLTSSHTPPPAGDSSERVERTEFFIAHHVDTGRLVVGADLPDTIDLEGGVRALLRFLAGNKPL